MNISVYFYCIFLTPFHTCRNPAANVPSQIFQEEKHILTHCFRRIFNVVSLGTICTNIAIKMWNIFLLMCKIKCLVTKLDVLKSIHLCSSGVPCWNTPSIYYPPLHDMAKIPLWHHEVININEPCACREDPINYGKFTGCMPIQG